MDDGGGSIYGRWTSDRFAYVSEKHWPVMAIHLIRKRVSSRRTLELEIFLRLNVRSHDDVEIKGGYCLREFSYFNNYNFITYGDYI